MESMSMSFYPNTRTPSASTASTASEARSPTRSRPNSPEGRSGATGDDRGPRLARRRSERRSVGFEAFGAEPKGFFKVKQIWPARLSGWFWGGEGVPKRSLKTLGVAVENYM